METMTVTLETASKTLPMLIDEASKILAENNQDGRKNYLYRLINQQRSNGDLILEYECWPCQQLTSAYMGHGEQDCVECQYYGRPCPGLISQKRKEGKGNGLLCH
ncbi:MAG: hypothetical protein ACLFUU_05880 [Desulfobacteraceae bacterium]